MDTERAESHLLRHYLATLVYRADKAIKEVPDHYPHMQLGKGVRSPIEILSHMTDVLTYAYSLFADGSRTTERRQIGTWEEEVGRFYSIVEKLDRSLSRGLPNTDRIAERLLQGPLSDAMTHVGQLSMLKRLADDPIPAESFFDAAIRAADC
jgi:hypothetical protein